VIADSRRQDDRITTAQAECAHVERLHNSANDGVLRMDVYAFHGADEAKAAA
jgi:4,5-DOPA dioxygenase extradiol